MTQTLLASLLAAAAFGVAAQPPQTPPPTLYRSVGPDGKITFSDRRPTDDRMQTRELGRRPQLRPLFTPALPLFEAPAAAAATARRLRSFPADGLSPAVSRTGYPFPPGLADAILIVTGHRFYVQSLMELCSLRAPARVERYQIAVQNWRERNADIFARADHITFAEFSGEQRDLLRATVQLQLEAVEPRADASAADVRDWCDRAALDLSRRQHELANDPRIAPIFDFASR